ncbi:hypothetical protein HDU67_004717 [Dinochytrium kinnereticum]|nr:hypothetical protein HDU67_004717 [Dinochytrium kinnereticum]
MRSSHDETSTTAINRGALLSRVAVLLITLLTIPSVLSNPSDYLTITGNALRHGHIPTANLDPAVVGSNTFGRIFPGGFTRLPTVNGVPPGTNYASPLVYTTASGRTVVFAATQNNNIYSVDGITGALLASRNVNPPFDMSRDIPTCGDINSNIGVTSTGVIDPTTGTAYFVSKSYAAGTSVGYMNGRYRVHAVDVATLVERPNFPKDLEGTVAENDSRKVFQGGIHLQRPGLHMYNNAIYIAFGAHCDQFNFTGWVIGVDGTTGTVLTAWATDAEPSNKGGAGIWQSGNGITAIDNRMYIITGNGNTSPTRTPTPGSQIPTILGMAIVELTINTARRIVPTDFFMPFNYQALNGGDRDFGSGGLTVFPNDTGLFTTPTVKRLGVAMGKGGTVYVVDVDNLGGFAMGPERSDNVLQSIQSPNSVFGQAAVFPANGGYMYFAPSGYPIQAYKWNVEQSTGRPAFILAGQSSFNTRQFCGSPIVTSLNGEDDTGIVWYIDFSGTLSAFRAVPSSGRLVQLFSDSPQGLYPYNKFLRPSFGNGRVYTVTSDGRMFAYGSPTNFPLTSPEANFGTVILGSPRTMLVNFTVQVDTVEVVSWVISDGNFTIGPNAPALPTSLTKGQTLSIPVTLNPSQTGFFTAQLNLQTTNNVRSLSFASLRGQGKSQSPQLELAPPALIYTGVVTNKGSVTSNALISNAGVEPLVIMGIVLPDPLGPFRVLNPPAVGTVIESGASLTVSIVFDPKVDGNWSDHLKVQTNGGNNFIILSGSSAGPPRLQLEYQLPDGTFSNETDLITFPPLLPGASATITLRVTNAGDSEMTITKVKVPQSGAIQGSILSIAEAQKIEHGLSILVPITFTHPSRIPAAAGAEGYIVTAELPLNTDDPDTGLKTVNFVGRVTFKPLTPPADTWVYAGCYSYKGPRILGIGKANGQPMTPQLCIELCGSDARKLPIAGVEYANECWCGMSLPATGMGSTGCTLGCRGDRTVACGGGGSLNVYYNPAIVNGTATTTITTVTSTPIATTTTVLTLTAEPTTTVLQTSMTSAIVTPPTPTATTVETTSTVIAIPTTTAILTTTATETDGPRWVYVGCTLDSPRLFPAGRQVGTGFTVTTCKEACIKKGFTFSGAQFGGECWCGANASTRTPTPETECNMPCTADRTQICGGRTRLSLHQYINPSTTTSRTPALNNPTLPSATENSPVTITPSPVTGWSYVGCTVSGGTFEGVAVARVFSGGRVGTGYAPGSCQTTCVDANKGYVFAGLEFG